MLTPFLFVLRTPAEELDVGLRNGFARRRVRNVVQHLLIKRLADNHHVINPDDDLAGVSIIHFCSNQVRSWLLQRRCDGDSIVNVIRSRLQSDRPVGDAFSEILCLVLRNDSVADVLNVELVSVEPLRIALQIFLHIGKQLFDTDGKGFELDQRPIAKPKIDDRSTSRRLNLRRLKPPPMINDLPERFFTPLPISPTAIADGLSPGLCSLRVLPAVFVDSSKLVSRSFAWPRLRNCNDFLVDRDEVVLVRKLEAKYSSGKTSDGLMVCQSVKRECSGLIAFGVLLKAVPHPAKLSHRLHTKLVIQKVGIHAEQFRSAVRL